MREIWKSITGFIGLYEVSNKGRVRTLTRKVRNTSKSCRLIKSRILDGHITFLGYSKHMLCKKTKRKLMLTHRLVANEFIPNPDNKPHINHINAIKCDNRIENLEWCTPFENIQHSVKMGLNKVGEESKLSKLTNSDVIKIRSLRHEHTEEELSSIFKVSRAQIGRIHRKERWKHL